MHLWQQIFYFCDCIVCWSFEIWMMVRLDIFKLCTLIRELGESDIIKWLLSSLNWMFWGWLWAYFWGLYFENTTDTILFVWNLIFLSFNVMTIVLTFVRFFMPLHVRNPGTSEVIREKYLNKYICIRDICTCCYTSCI